MRPLWYHYDTIHRPCINRPLWYQYETIYGPFITIYRPLWDHYETIYGPFIDHYETIHGIYGPFINHYGYLHSWTIMVTCIYNHSRHTWIQRATRRIEGYSAKWGLEDWVHLAKKRIFNWAGHVSRRHDNRWSTEMLDWTPPRGRLFQEEGQGRLQSRPKTRWEDCLVDYFSTTTTGFHWRIYAEIKSEWDTHVTSFSNM